MNIAQLIQDSLFADNGVKNIAESQLQHIMSEEPAVLIMICSQELAKEDLKDILRQRISTLLESTLLEIDKFWKSLNNEIRQQLLSNLLEALAFDNNEVREITSNMISLIFDALIKNSFKDLKEEDEQIIDAIFVTMASLLKSALKEEVIRKHIQHLLEKMHNTDAINGKKKERIQLGFLLCLQTLLDKLQLQSGDQIVDNILKALDEIFQSGNLDTCEMGLLILCNLISGLGPNFKPYFKGCWPWISQSFSQINSIDYFHGGLAAIVSLTEVCPDEMNEHLEEILSTQVTLLKNPDFNKKSKLKILTAIGDIALNCKDLVLPYVETLSNVYEVSLKVACENPSEKSSEVSEYLEQLRDILLESYTCFLQAFTDSPNVNSVLNGIPCVMEFLTVTCSPSFNPTPAYLKSALGLIADIGWTFLPFKDQVRQYIKSDFTANLVKDLSKFADDPEYLEIIEYAKSALEEF